MDTNHSQNDVRAVQPLGGSGGPRTAMPHFADASELRDLRVPRFDAMDDFRRSNVDAENHRDVIVLPDIDAAR